MSAHGWSWVLMPLMIFLRDPEWWFACYSNKQKMLIYKWLPSSILPISWSRFHQIIKTWIFFKCTWRGLWENAQDGFSRPLGSELSLCQTLEHFLWNTLYLPQIFLSKLFLEEKVWLEDTLPTYSLDICPNFCNFFRTLCLPRKSTSMCNKCHRALKFCLWPTKYSNVFDIKLSLIFWPWKLLSLYCLAKSKGLLHSWRYLVWDSSFHNHNYEGIYCVVGQFQKISLHLKFSTLGSIWQQSRIMVALVLNLYVFFWRSHTAT